MSKSCAVKLWNGFNWHGIRSGCVPLWRGWWTFWVHTVFTIWIIVACSWLQSLARTIFTAAIHSMKWHHTRQMWRICLKSAVTFSWLSLTWIPVLCGKSVFPNDVVVLWLSDYFLTRFEILILGNTVIRLCACVMMCYSLVGSYCCLHVLSLCLHRTHCQYSCCRIAVTANMEDRMRQEDTHSWPV